MTRGEQAKRAWRETVGAFYVSGAWIDCSRAFRRAHPLCQRCREKGVISPATEVHHKIRLTPGNINNPMITLNWDNLEALCAACHRQETWKRRQEKDRERRWTVDQEGHVLCQAPLSPAQVKGGFSSQG